MYELIPIFAGAAVGLLAARLIGRRVRAVLIVAVAVAAAVVAGMVSGELARSWAFLLWDATQALVAAGLTLALASLAPSAIRHDK